MQSIPDIRVRAVNDRPTRDDGEYVLYWMTAFRRLDFNFALERAAGLSREMDRPLVVLEALRVDYPWASDRFHRFILDGMLEHDRRLDGSNVRYWPYVERSKGDGGGLLKAISERACVVVTDDFPCFFHPKMIEAAGRALDVRLEAVDSNGLYPIREAEREFTRAHSFRIHLQKHLAPHLDVLPDRHPLKGSPLPGPAVLPRDVIDRWPRASRSWLESGADALAELPIDHAVEPTGVAGGTSSAREVLERFLDDRLDRYDEDRNHPDREGASGLSPWLHFGHLSAHEVFAAVAEREGWTPSDLSSSTRGSRSGWWGMSAPAEAFLDELVTWREIGFNQCVVRDDYDRYESLPDWARATLEEHASDRREHVYDLETFERAETHDELWNAAQRQLRAEGRIHNYLRMLWGKKVLEWTEKPQDALDVLIELNNKYALDGRDPNSYSGIFWVLGRFDRAWGPERPVFGKVRYMTSDSTRRKLKLRDYLERWAS